MTPQAMTRMTKSETMSLFSRQKRMILSRGDAEGGGAHVPACLLMRLPSRMPVGIRGREDLIQAFLELPWNFVYS